MVDFEHDCEDERCPFCELADGLEEIIHEASKQPEHVWNKVVGGLSDRLFDAVWAINRTRRTGFTDEWDPIANEHEAAAKLVQVFHLLEGFRDQLVVSLTGPEEGRAHLERCRPGDHHPAAVLSCPREGAAKGLRGFAPQASAKLGERLPPGEFWIVTIAAGGTQVGKLRTQEATS